MNTQDSYIWDGAAMIRIDLPSPENEVVNGVKWGAVCEFPSPAYWKYQVAARQIQGEQIRYRFGESIIEEIGACLLGGHGIPAAVGNAAFEHMKRRGVFDGQPHCEADLLAWLQEPITYGEKTIRYRFAKQKAKYLAAALAKLAREQAPLETGRMLRDWLTGLPGIGYKTASWVARNTLDADDVAILDIHILRAGQIGGFLDAGLTVQRHYLQIEGQFLAFSHGLGVRASELDAVIWYEMMSSPRTIRKTMGASMESGKQITSKNLPGPKQSHSGTKQAVVLI